MRDATARIEGKVDDIREGVDGVREIAEVCSFGMNIYILKFD